MNAPIMLGIKDAAAKAGIPVHALRQWVAAGQVHAVTSGKKYFVNWASLTRFLEGNTE